MRDTWPFPLRRRSRIGRRPRADSAPAARRTQDNVAPQPGWRSSSSCNLRGAVARRSGAKHRGRRLSDRGFPKRQTRAGSMRGLGPGHRAEPGARADSGWPTTRWCQGWRRHLTKLASRGARGHHPPPARGPRTRPSARPRRESPSSPLARRDGLKSRRSVRASHRGRILPIGRRRRCPDLRDHETFAAACQESEGASTGVV